MDSQAPAQSSSFFDSIPFLTKKTDNGLMNSQSPVQSPDQMDGGKRRRRIRKSRKAKKSRKVKKSKKSKRKVKKTKRRTKSRR